MVNHSQKTNMEETKYTAVTDERLRDACGTIVWWRLSGGIDLARLTEAWKASGLDPAWLPEPPSADVALHRAMCEHRTSTHLVRALKNGWALVQERVEGSGDDEKLRYTELVRASLNKVGRPHVVGAYDLEPVVEARYHNRIDQDFDHYSNTLTQADLPAWLSRMMTRVNATTLRPTGGVNFVPRTSLATWEKVVGALHAASSHKVFGVPAMPTADALDAIMDAIEQEAQGEIEAIEEQLIESDLGVRALHGRITKTERINDKLSEYEDLLGRRSTAMHEKIEKLRANISIAIIKAEAAEARTEGGAS